MQSTDFKLISEIPPIIQKFPQIRFMGSKYRLLPWIYEILAYLDFNTALDAFSGSGCVSYLMKAMGKQVTSSDALNFSSIISKAIIENSNIKITKQDIQALMAPNSQAPEFIFNTFQDVFFTADDLHFLDNIWANLRLFENPYKIAIVLSALIRSSVKRQPRGVFTVAGDPDRYKDGRRDLQLSIQEHFLEQIQEYNRAVFDNGKENSSLHQDVFDLDPRGFDLVYMDPPYVPRSDDNCYIKRYHFLEGLSCYWEGLDILKTSKVKKIKKRFTPFSYKKTAVQAFDKMFERFSKSILVLSYSSNGYPDLEILIDLMKKHKSSIKVFDKEHHYHFGTHKTATRNHVLEYLIVGI